ncbi:hypothetical protein SAMN05421786_10245 [Chryseobacterium ureilyticum]|uniref:Uncharacterized protein n=1 Tax=Chryseobacterium ureilyticum TaxID=373668 RepID=A0A1N7LWJ4_9FLAO|nr:hypothetical protein [Chryseobacterium ureilyticum]SIS78187.1 hypothetical protein SAMN05421786_10245 [Chryseobacterium ureilyticum]
MKNYIYSKLGLAFAVCAFMFSTNTQAQIKANQTIANASINSSTAFLDAASSVTWNGSSTLGKGMLFPRTDLTQLVLTNNGGFLAGNNPNRFDGIIVYNTATGNTPATGSGIGNQPVAPGFYYFSNPGSPTAVTTGQWIAVGASPKVTIGTNEVATNTLINVSTGVDKQVYAIKGSFTTTGTSTSVTIPSPTGMTSLYGITIYKVNGTGNKVVYSRDLYSYNIGATNNAITGSPSMSVVYPADTYDYVLEYIK